MNYSLVASFIYFQLYLEEGKLKVYLETAASPKAILDNFEERFDDGQWHYIIFSITKNSLILNVDQKPMKTKKLIEFSTGGIYYIGGMYVQLVVYL